MIGRKVIISLISQGFCPKVIVVSFVWTWIIADAIITNKVMTSTLLSFENVEKFKLKIKKRTIPQDSITMLSLKLKKEHNVLVIPEKYTVSSANDKV